MPNVRRGYRAGCYALSQVCFSASASIGRFARSIWPAQIGFEPARIECNHARIAVKLERALRAARRQKAQRHRYSQAEPFEPRIDTLPDGRKIIVARGACDDKGQAMTFVEACRAYKAVTGSLPLPITMMIEGEEESGSASLEPFMNSHREALACDVAVVSDTGMWDIDTPAITTST